MADKILALQASYWSRIKEAPPSTKVNIMFSSQKSSLTTCILSPIGVFSIELSASAKELVLKRNDIRSIESEASILFGMKGKEVSPRAKIIEPISAAQIVDNGFELSRNIVLSEVIPDFSFFLIKVRNLTLDLFQPKNIGSTVFCVQGLTVMDEIALRSKLLRKEIFIGESPSALVYLECVDDIMRNHSRLKGIE